MRVTKFDISLYIITRTKDNKFVYCAMDTVLGQTLEKARSEGLQLTTVIHKVSKAADFIALTNIPLIDRPSVVAILELWHGEGSPKACSQISSNHTTLH